MIEIACPHCGSINQREKSFAGKRVACTSCRKEFKIPASLGLLSSSASAPESTSAGPTDTEPRRGTGTSAFAPRAASPTAGEAMPVLDDLELELDEPNALAQPPDVQPSATPYRSSVYVSPNAPTAGQTPSSSSSLPSSPSSSTPKAASYSSGAGSPASAASSHDAPLPFDSLDDEAEYRLEGTQSIPVISQREAAPASNSAAVDELELWGESEQVAVQYSDKRSDASPPVYDSVESPLKLEGLADASADDIRANCLVCDAGIWVKRHKAGSTIICPDCGSEVKVAEAPKTYVPPQGPTAGKVTSTVFSGVASSDSSTSAGWRDSAKPLDKSERAKRLEQLDGQKVLPKTRQRLWGEEAPAESDSPAPETSAKDDRENRPTPEPGQFDVDDWLKDAFKVFGSVGFWGGIACMAVVNAIYFPMLWFAYSMTMDESGMVLVGAMRLILNLIWFVNLLVVAVVSSTITLDTANRNDRIESWPELTGPGLISSALCFLLPYLVSSIPGIVLSQLLVAVGIPAAVVLPLLSLIQPVLFGPLYLSVLRNGSPWQLYDRDLYQSTLYQTKVWLIGYVMILVLGLGGAIAIAGVLMFGICAALPAAVFAAVIWGLMMRVYGILGRRLIHGMN